MKSTRIMTTQTLTVAPGQVLSLSQLPPRTELVFKGDSTGNISILFTQGNAVVAGDKKQVIRYSPSPSSLANPSPISGAFPSGFPLLIGTGLHRGQLYDPTKELYEQLVQHDYGVKINGQSEALFLPVRLTPPFDIPSNGSTQHGSVYTSDCQIQAVATFTIEVSSLWNPQLSAAPAAYNPWLPLYAAIGFFVLALIGFMFRDAGVLMRFVEAVGIMGVIGSAAWRAYQYFVYRE